MNPGQWLNYDLNASKFRKDFETYTHLITDSHMDTYNQITFGCYQDSYIPQNFSNIETILKSNINQPKKLSDTPFNKNIKDKIIIPINQSEYNLFYNKTERYLPRLDWNNFNWKSKSINKIKIGKRHSSIPLLCSFIIFHALLNNQTYNTNFNIKDCDRKIKYIIQTSFDMGNSFYNEEQSYIISTTYNIWNQFINISDINNLYKNLCKKLNIKEKYKYIPRSCSIKQSLYLPNKSILLNTNIKSKDHLLDIALNITKGDTASADIIIRYTLTDRNKLNLPKLLRKKRNTKYQYILDYTKKTQKKIFYYVNKSMKEFMFCYKHQIQYIKKSIINNLNNFLNTTKTYCFPFYDITIGSKKEIVLENNVISINNFIKSDKKLL